MSDDIKSENIVIEKMSTDEYNGSKVHRIEAGGKRFSFWEEKKDGTKTKAFLGFEKFALEEGGIVRVHYTENSRKYTDKKGEDRIAIDRNVLWFSLAGDDSFPTPGREASQDILARVEAMSIWGAGIEPRVAKLEEDFKAIRTLLVDLKGKEAVELHESFGGSV